MSNIADFHASIQVRCGGRCIYFEMTGHQITVMLDERRSPTSEYYAEVIDPGVPTVVKGKIRGSGLSLPVNADLEMAEFAWDKETEDTNILLKSDQSVLGPNAPLGDEYLYYTSLGGTLCDRRHQRSETGSLYSAQRVVSNRN